ncbi:MAG: hypothetical protein WBB74_12080 [Gaiellaceae bacterium]
MKPSLIILTAVAIVVAAVSGSSRLAAAPPSSPEVAKPACTFASLPRATSVGEQALYGHIKSLTRKGRRFVLRFDPAWQLSGVTASRAALEDTGSSEVPNDTYTRDESHRLLTYLVPATAHVTVLTHATCSTSTTVAKLAKSVPPAGFWIRVRIDTVRSIDQQYHP